MSRSFIGAAAQLGPIARDEPRSSAVARMMQMMRDAKARGAELVVFPELALTTFFPRWYIEDEAEIVGWFETEMPSRSTQPLFDLAVELGIGFHLGYAELTPQGRRFNTAILVDATGSIVGKYRKIHLPGHQEHEDWRPFQHLEKRYFEKGDLGFPVFDAIGGKLGMCICNDRRWPETWRMLGLGGAELVVLGYNTPQHYPPAPEHDHLQYFHNELSIQAGCYQNGLWAIATAKAGREEGCDLIGGSVIVAPTGEILARAAGTDDEVITARIDLDRCGEIRRNVFDFAKHRQPADYGRLVE
ncbi:N-carbamoyl-D-amino-acid hydrolase [Aliiruegeria sabulilitoris]|uniref:N-carbamoyl-D-amino-acid hydrolase n=1 Tax=Aliiruegeria sabulilitoris TaxID=1510458 RepID=UPI00082D33FF|nr:N-carbamoyl-D-amino-acid hydrolase [Aliiruegeria sabulilitoris]NDR57727.1 N-carbamoyl-D-amino-acid hydrolase [Pseudoruegeria sp. M32A2M]